MLSIGYLIWQMYQFVLDQIRNLCHHIIHLPMPSMNIFHEMRTTDGRHSNTKDFIHVHSSQFSVGKDCSRWRWDSERRTKYLLGSFLVVHVICCHLRNSIYLSSDTDTNIMLFYSIDDQIVVNGLFRLNRSPDRCQKAFCWARWEMNTFRFFKFTTKDSRCVKFQNPAS
jgi:hypothetical protein